MIFFLNILLGSNSSIAFKTSALQKSMLPSSIHSIFQSILSSIILLSFSIIFFYSCSKNPNHSAEKEIKGKIQEELKEKPKKETFYSQSFSIKDLGQGKKLITDSRKRKFLLLSKKELSKKTLSKNKFKNASPSKTLVNKKNTTNTTNITNTIIEDSLLDSEIQGIFKIPLDRILLGSTTQASFLKTLGLLDRVLAVPFSNKSWSIPEIQQGLRNKTIHSIGEPHSPDLERIRVLDPSLAFVYGGTGVQRELIQELNRFHIPYIVANPHMERTLLERLSWIVFFSVFFEKESKAKEFFQQAQEKIRWIQEKTQKLPNKKKLIWASTYQGLFYTSPKTSYIHDLIQIAGGEIPFPETKRFHQLTQEEFYFHAKDADIFIVSSSLPESIHQLTQESPILKNLRSIQEKQVWKIHPDWHQNLHQLPQQTQELSQILYPELWNNSQHFQHFIRLK